MKMIYTLLLSLSIALPLYWYGSVNSNYGEIIIGLDPNPNEDVRANLNGMLALDKKLEDHEIVVLNLWGTWCQPCVGEIPQLNAIMKDYSDRGVRFLAFSDEDPSKLKKFNFENFKKRKPELIFNYEQIFGNRKVTAYIRSMDTTRNGRGVPIHVLLKKDGSIGKVLLGASEAYDKVIRDFLNSEITN